METQASILSRVIIASEMHWSSIKDSIFVSAVNWKASYWLLSERVRSWCVCFRGWKHSTEKRSTPRFETLYIYIFLSFCLLQFCKTEKWHSVAWSDKQAMLCQMMTVVKRRIEWAKNWRHKNLDSREEKNGLCREERTVRICEDSKNAILLQHCQSTEFVVKLTTDTAPAWCIFKWFLLLFKP